MFWGEVFWGQVLFCHPSATWNRKPKKLPSAQFERVAAQQIGKQVDRCPQQPPLLNRAALLFTGLLFTGLLFTGLLFTGLLLTVLADCGSRVSARMMNQDDGWAGLRLYLDEPNTLF